MSAHIASYQGDMCKFLSNSITPLRFLRIKCTLGISEYPLLPRIRHGPGTWKVSKRKHDGKPYPPRSYQIMFAAACHLHVSCICILEKYIYIYIHYVHIISYHWNFDVSFFTAKNINISSRCPMFLPWAKRFHSVPTPCKVRMANPSCPDPFGLKRLLSHSTPAYVWTKMCSVYM